MNLFNYLNNLIFTKKQPSRNTVEQASDYQPFLINRWCSMHDKQTANIINTTVNTMFPVFEDKTKHYSFLHKILPRAKFSKINYIKKVKKEPLPEQIAQLARNVELSQREINHYVEQLNITFNNENK